MILFTLTRTDFLKTGIFGMLESEEVDFGCFTLEHAYPAEPGIIGTFWPKLPAGTYLCQRGMHRLEGMFDDFETFEVTGVPGHSGILFHVGNYNKDSSGCILVGISRHEGMIAGSKQAFDKFMEELTGVDQFQLQVL